MRGTPSDTITHAEFTTTFLHMTAGVMGRLNQYRSALESVVNCLDRGDANLARQVAASAAGLDKTPPLAQDSIRCAVDAALPRNSATGSDQGGMG